MYGRLIGAATIRTPLRRAVFAIIAQHPEWARSHDTVGTFFRAEADGLKRVPLRATQDVRRLELNFADAVQRRVNRNTLGRHGHTLFRRSRPRLRRSLSRPPPRETPWANLPPEVSQQVTCISAAFFFSGDLL
jgi:hypothetical protein